MENVNDTGKVRGVNGSERVGVVTVGPSPFPHRPVSEFPPRCNSLGSQNQKLEQDQSRRWFISFDLISGDRSWRSPALCAKFTRLHAAGNINRLQDRVGCNLPLLGILVILRIGIRALVSTSRNKKAEYDDAGRDPTRPCTASSQVCKSDLTHLQLLSRLPRLLADSPY